MSDSDFEFESANSTFEDYEMRPGTDSFAIMFETFLVTICVITTVLNLTLILAIVSQSGHNRTPNYAYLIGLNLSIINFLVGVCVIAPLVAQIHFRQDTTLFGESGCLVYAFLFNIYLVGTPLFMLLNATERYIAVVYPLRLATLITKPRLWIAICSVWLVLILYGLITVFGSGLVLVDNVKWCQIALFGLSAQLSSLVTSVILVDLPIAGLVVLYGIICLKLWQSVKTHRQLQETQMLLSSPTASTQNDQSRSNAVKDEAREIGNFVDNKTKFAKHERLTVPRSNNLTSRANTDAGCSKATSARSSFSAPGGSEAIRRRQRTTQMLIVTVLSHILCCMPFNLYTILQYMENGNFPRPGKHFDYYLTMWSMPVLLCSSAINPVVYLVMSKNLRSKISATFLNCKRRASNEQPLPMQVRQGLAIK